MQSSASTASAYLRSLPDDRRKIVSALRKLIRANLPDGYVEAMRWGMLCYEVPLKRFPNTYNGQPLGYVALASQKQYCSLYLHCVYADPAARRSLAKAFRSVGKKLDMGKCCIRFKRLDDLPLDAIAAEIARTPVDAFLAQYQRARGSTSARANKRPDAG